MPVTRLFPNATSGASLATNAASHHAGLSDASDGTYSHAQVSSSEPVKVASGPSLTQLPASTGVMKGVTIHCRAFIATGGNGDISLIAGENASNRFGGILTTTPTTYATGQLNLGGFAAVNALGWNVGLQFVQNGAPLGRILELDFDVEWLPVSGFSAFIMSLAGPLAAVGLHEMPRLSAHLWARHRTRLLRHELALAWRDLRADPRRRYVWVGR